MRKTRSTSASTRRPTTRSVAKSAARWLVARHASRARFEGFPAGIGPTDVGMAYAAQDEFVAAKSAHCGPPLGWKIALSNPAMQQLVGLHEPISGRLHARQVVDSPATTCAASYGRLLVEFEIAVELGHNLPARAGGYKAVEVAAAVAAVMPAFELANDRNADYESLGSHRLQLIADNAWNEGAVLGERCFDWKRLDLADLTGRVAIDGAFEGAGTGRDLMGHPLEALAWVASHASRRGQAIKAGEIVILGSLVTSKFPVVGQHFRFTLDGFAPIELKIA